MKANTKATILVMFMGEINQIEWVEISNTGATQNSKIDKKVTANIVGSINEARIKIVGDAEEYLCNKLLVKIA